jgi:hypothetical protein
VYPHHSQAIAIACHTMHGGPPHCKNKTDGSRVGECILAASLTHPQRRCQNGPAPACLHRDAHPRWITYGTTLPPHSVLDVKGRCVFQQRSGLCAAASVNVKHVGLAPLRLAAPGECLSMCVSYALLSAVLRHAACGCCLHIPPQYPSESQPLPVSACQLSGWHRDVRLPNVAGMGSCPFCCESPSTSRHAVGNRLPFRCDATKLWNLANTIFR